jgi:hypothetical protein
MKCRVAPGSKALVIGQVNAVRIVRRQHQLAFEHLSVGAPKGQGRCSGEGHLAGRDYLVTVNPDVDARSGGRKDVSPIALVARREAREIWILVSQIDPRHPRHQDRGDRIGGRPDRPRDDVIAKRPIDGFKA